MWMGMRRVRALVWGGWAHDGCFCCGCFCCGMHRIESRSVEHRSELYTQYTRVWFLLRGYPLQIFYFAPFLWNWKKILVTGSIRLGYQEAQIQAHYPSDMPVFEPMKGGIPCEFFILQFFILQFSILIERILKTGYPVGGCGWCGWWSERRCVQPLPYPTDFNSLHLICREINDKISILTVVGG